MAESTIRLVVSEDDPDVAYLYLPEHPGAGSHKAASKQIRLLDLIPGYMGPDVYFDFDSENRLIGIEIV
jgi:uncharacterized protein YuzE